jgi:AmiR/NasT family two-component response regulator
MADLLEAVASDVSRFVGIAQEQISRDFEAETAKDDLVIIETGHPYSRGTQ